MNTASNSTTHIPTNTTVCSWINVICNIIYIANTNIATNILATIQWPLLLSLLLLLLTYFFWLQCKSIQTNLAWGYQPPPISTMVGGRAAAGKKNTKNTKGDNSKRRHLWIGTTRSTCMEHVLEAMKTSLCEFLNDSNNLQTQIEELLGALSAALLFYMSTQCVEHL